MDARIIIVDDRPLRQKEDLGAGQKDDRYKTLKSLPNVTLVTGFTDFDDFDGYAIIAVHRSYLIQKDRLEELISYIKTSKKYLVLFSGGISEQNVDLNGHYLSLNSKEFYSQHLLDFITGLSQTDDINLYKLLYGNLWKLPLLLRYRQIKWRTENDEGYNDEWMADIEEEFPEDIKNIDKVIGELLIQL